MTDLATSYGGTNLYDNPLANGNHGLASTLGDFNFLDSSTNSGYGGNNFGIGSFMGGDGLYGGGGFGLGTTLGGDSLFGGYAGNSLGVGSFMGGDGLYNDNTQPPVYGNPYASYVPAPVSTTPASTSVDPSQPPEGVEFLCGLGYFHRDTNQEWRLVNGQWQAIPSEPTEPAPPLPVTPRADDLDFPGCD